MSGPSGSWSNWKVRREGGLVTRGKWGSVNLTEVFLFFLRPKVL